MVRLPGPLLLGLPLLALLDGVPLPLTGGLVELERVLAQDLVADGALDQDGVVGGILGGGFVVGGLALGVDCGAGGAVAEVAARARGVVRVFG